jgi:uncharacterized protein (TIGR00290 family)
MKTILSWSTGKDSAWSLHVLRQTPGIKVTGLLTTINEALDCVAMHGVRRTLLLAQADAVGVPLHIISLPSPCSNEIYDERMAMFVREAQADGVEAIAFGDLHLEDIRAYRESRLDGSGLKPLFPLWQLDTHDLAHRMIASGLRAKITCLDPSKLPRTFAGRAFDEDFLRDLPAEIDPCGELGEFHTFAHAGPMFDRSVAISTGETIEHDGFVFADLRPSAR